MWCLITTSQLQAQCPQITNAELNQTDLNFCLGEVLTFTAEGIDLPPGDVIDWYISQTMGFNPYDNEGAYVGTSQITEAGGDTIVAPFIWTIPLDFCNTFEPGTYFVTGILNPPPSGGCMETFTEEFQIHISCPSASLTGDIAVCSENCPDDPGLITFDFSGGIEPYSIDIIVTASGFPPFQIPGLAFDASGAIYLCIGGFFPSYDPGTQTVTVPEFLIGQQITITLQSITDDEGCVGEIIPPGQLQINLYDSPIANAGGDQTICEDDFATLNGSISGSAQTSEWITPGDGSFGNPFSLQTTYTPGANDILNGSVTLTLIAFEPNDGCEPDSSSLEITILGSPQADAGPDQTICNDDLVQLSGSISGATFATWSSSGDGSFNNILDLDAIYTPGPGDNISGLVTLYLITDDVGGQCEPGMDSMLVTLVAPPVISGPEFGTVCLGDIAFLPHVVNGDAGTILWTSGGDGTFDDPMSASTFYTPGTQDTTNGQVILTLTVTDPLGICDPVEFEYVLTLLSCGCPPFVIEEPQDPVCNIDGELDLSQLIIVSDPGTWQITVAPPGLNPAIVIGDLFMAINADPGPYTVSYILDNPFPGCPVSVNVTVEVIEMLQLFAGSDQNACSSDPVLLNGSYTGEPGSILWTSSGMGVFSDETLLSGMYSPDAADLNAGFVTLVLTGSDSAGVCPVVSDALSITFITSLDSVLIDNSVAICNDSLFGSVIDLHAFVIADDTTGVWLNLSGFPFDLSDPGNVHFDSVPPSTYAFLYMAPALLPCDPVSDTLFVEVLACVCPQLLVNPLPSAVCNSGPGVDLNAFITSSQPGAWTLISAPPGSMPAVLGGSFFNTTGADPGDYAAMFRLDTHVAGCPDSAILDISVALTPFTDAGSDTTLCSTDILVLSGNVNAGVSSLQWATSGDGVFQDASELATSYIPGILDILNGSVQISLAGADTSGVCPVTLSSFILTLQSAPLVIFDTSFLTVCNFPDSGSVINFISHIASGDTGGIWIDVNGSGVDVSDPTQVDFDGIPAGLYVFQYTTMSAIPPCAETSYDITVLVRDCACPDLTLVNTPAVLCNNDTLDLSTLILVLQTGNWEVMNMNGYPNPPVINTDQMSTLGSSPGTYWLQFNLETSVPGCSDVTGFFFNVVAIPQFVIVHKQCQFVDSTYDVTLTTDAGTVISNAGVVTSGQGDTVFIHNVPLSDEITISLTSTFGFCTIETVILPPVCNCALQITNVPDSITLCPGETKEIFPQITGAMGSFSVKWVTPLDTLAGLNIELSEQGLYSFLVTDAFGCSQEVQVRVLSKPEMILTLKLSDPTCPGLDDGSITIETIQNGDVPILYALDGNPFQGINSFPQVINGLSAGDFDLILRDFNGCEKDTFLSLTEPSLETLELGPDIKIKSGDSVWISPVMSFVPLSFMYAPSLLQSLEGWLTPAQSGILTLSAVDSNGCMYSDELFIEVEVLTTDQIFAPNTFSPNGDQINDTWTLYSSDPLVVIRALSIYDRWGDNVFDRIDIPVNDPTAGWDGTGNGKEMNPGVYVFHAIVERVNGTLVQVSGDITLLK